eukprot:scaffold23437_cov75-Isochrysis_galbana.AAC.1
MAGGEWGGQVLRLGSRSRGGGRGGGCIRQGLGQRGHLWWWGGVGMRLSWGVEGGGGGETRRC